MTRKFIAVVHASIVMGGKELDLLAKVRFTHVPAYPGRGPRYADGGLPPEPECVEDVEVIDLVSDTNGFCPTLTRPDWLCEWIAANVDEADLLAEVDYGPDPDEMRERQRDEAMDRREENRMWGAEE